MAPLLGIETQGEFMPVIIEALLIKFVLIVINISHAYAVAKINIHRIVGIPASLHTCLAPEDIVVRSDIDIFDDLILDPELICSFKINLPAVVIGYESCLVYIFTEIAADIIVSYMIVLNIVLSCKSHKPGAMCPEISGCASDELTCQVPCLTKIKSVIEASRPRI